MKTIIAVLGFALLVMPALAATEQQENLGIVPKGCACQP